MVIFPAGNLVINNSSISGLQVFIHQKKRSFVEIIHIRNTILKHVVVRGDEHNSQGYTTYFIDNCTFIQSSLHFTRFRMMHIASSMFNINCQSKGCALTLTEPNYVNMDITHINAMCDLFEIKVCNGIYLSNIDFITTESEANLLMIEGNQTVIENCTFSVSNSVQKYFEGNLIFEVRSKIIHLINVKVNVTEVWSVHNIPLFSINMAKLNSQSVLFLCPKSFKVIEQISEKDNNSQFLCQKDVCQNDKCSLMGHSKLNSIASVHNRKKHALIQLIPSCFPCPVGASCEQERVVALPNYSGKRKDHVYSMFRCPEDYCCQSKESCSDIDSCNGLRTGILCGHCGPNMTESFISTSCVDSKTCKPGVIINMYILAVALYSLGLLSFDIVKDKVFTCFSKVCKKFKNKIFKKDQDPAAENIEKISQENREKESQETQAKEDSMNILLCTRCKSL